MKIVQVMLFLMLGLLLYASTSIAQMPWENPWSSDDSVSLRTLINNEYRIVSTNTVYIQQQQFTIEYIYLQKGSDIYKCVTMIDITTREKQHGCERLINIVRHR